MANPMTEPPGGPDELEQLRAARGEGWQWQRIQEEACPQCGYNPSEMANEALGPQIVALAADWRAFLAEADDGYLRHIPEPGVFSPLQYAAHVDGMLEVAGNRVELGLAEERPVVPMFNPAQDEWARYNELPAEVVAGGLEDHAARLAGILAGLSPEAWERVVVNDRGAYGVVIYTLAGLGRNAVHESHHHLLDARGTLSGAPS